jgi:hypothetical protein
LEKTVASFLPVSKYQFHLYQTPHLPHGWDASLTFEETRRTLLTLLCSDLVRQSGDVEPLTDPM